MALQTYSGNISGTVDLVNDTHQVTGSSTIINATTLTFDIGSASKTSDLNTFDFTGTYSLIVDGKIVCNGAEGILITMQNTSRHAGASNDLIFNAVDSGSSVTHTIISNFDTVFVNASYAGGLTFDDNIVKNCQRAMQHQSSTQLVVNRCEFKYNTDILFVISSGNLSLQNCYIHDNSTVGAHFLFSPAGTLVINECFFKNTRTLATSASRGFFDLNLVANTVTITDSEFIGVAAETYGLFYQGSSGTVDVTDCNFYMDGDDWFSRDCLNANFTFTNCDIRIAALPNSAMKLGSNGANFDGCSVSGGFTSDGSDPDVIHNVADTGTADGLASTASNPVNTVDSWLNGKTTRNRPQTISTESMGTPDSDSVTYTGTSNARGRIRFVYGTVSVADQEYDYDNDDYSMSTNWHYEKILDATDGERQGFLGARTFSIENLKPDTTYYGRAVVECFDGKMVFGDEQSWTTDPAAGGGIFNPFEALVTG